MTPSCRSVEGPSIASAPGRRRRASRLVLALASWASLATSSCGHVHEPPPSPAAVPATKPDHEHGAETGLTVSSTPQGLMRDGAESKLQERLRAKDLLPAGHRTGQLDADTREALRRYQKRAGLPATGLPSYETVRSLDLPLEAIFLAVEPRSGRESGRAGGAGSGAGARATSPAAGTPARRAE